MARRTKKAPKDYPNAIIFDENLEGVANIFEEEGINIPDIYIANKGATDHILASDLYERTVLFTCDKDWLTRQPPYNHGGIVFLDTGNLSIEGKKKIIYEFLFAFHMKNKLLDTLRNNRYRLSKTSLYEMTPDGKSTKIW